MVKNVREYKAGDFIFAKVKGYPAWPARVTGAMGKKYFVFFYGTGETANLPPNMIFDYAEYKDKFLTKSVKRRDFVAGAKQIEEDFVNKVPLEKVVGITLHAAQQRKIDTANDSTINETMDDSVADSPAADDQADESAVNTTQNETGVEDSDDTGALVIDEGKSKGKKSKATGKETPAKLVKDPKTPRGKSKKEEQSKKGEEEEEKKEEEIVSRSGRKIRPKRYIDEQTEENTTLPSPAPKKRRTVSPAPEIQKEKPEEKEKEKVINSVPLAQLEDLKAPFKSDDPEKDNILMAYLPSGQYVGVKLFQSRPSTFRNEASRLQWDKQAAANAITLKMQLEKGQITPQSVITQLVMDLNLTDEEKATLDKERETEEKKCRVQFLKTEMKLIELDAKIKTCLSLEKADTELCLKLLDELLEMDVKPLMLLKHPTCLETVKRMRAYVGNTPSWDLSETASILFSKQAHRIRKQADNIYKNLKDLFTTPEGLSFWEFFSERVLHFKKATSHLSPDELLELVHEPLEMSVPTSFMIKAAVEAANEEKERENEASESEEQQQQQKKRSPQAQPIVVLEALLQSKTKAKKPTNNNAKSPIKRQSSRKLIQEEKDNELAQENDTEELTEKQLDTEGQESEREPEENDKETELAKELEMTQKMIVDEETEKESDNVEKEVDTSSKDAEDISKESEKSLQDVDETTDDNAESKAEEKVEEKKKEEMGEPRAKRTRGESKKTEAPPPRSPAKRKVKS